MGQLLKWHELLEQATITKDHEFQPIINGDFKIATCICSMLAVAS